MEQALRQAGLAYDIEWTTGPGDGARIAGEAWQRGRRRMLVAGGDGSVHDVVNGLMRARQARRDSASTATPCTPTVVPLPLGTGNDWSRSLALPRDPARLAAIVRRDHAVSHDVGRIDFGGADGTAAQTCWFINVAGAGYDAWVTERVPRPVPSALTYLRIALAGLAQYRSPHFRITADGRSIEGRLLLAFVANAQYCGNRMHVVPTARLDDGRLDVLAVEELSLAQVLPKLAKLYGGRILGDRAVRHLEAERVRIETDPPVSVQADGQIVGTTPAEFSLQQRALSVAVPAGT